MADHDLIEETIDTATDDGEMAVLITRPAESPEAHVVLIFHDGPGIRTATRVFMRKLAAEGYCVVTPDLYHRQGRLLGIEPGARAADPSLSQQMWTWLGSVTDEGIQHDGDQALLAAGVAVETSIATIGFCMGARAVFRRMMREPERVVSGAVWHPSFLVDEQPNSPHLSADRLTSPLYLAIGDADEVQSIAMHQRFLDAVAPLDHVTVDIFEGADHGFTWPDHATYDAPAADGAWNATTALFADTFA